MAWKATVVAAAVLAGALGAGRAAAGVNGRQHLQAARIHEGVCSGELTRSEAARLNSQQARLRAEERLYRATGAQLSPWERADLRRDQNRISRSIARQKHD